MRNNVFLKGLSLVAMFVLSACGQSDPYQDLRDELGKIKEHENALFSQPKEDHLKLPIPVNYHAFDLRDPFATHVLFNRSGNRVATNPLQAYSLSVLRLLGTVTENRMSIAYVIAPDNMVYQIREGDVIGDHDGRVITVLPSGVNVMEIVTENGQEGVQRIVSLKLKDEQ